MSQKLKKIKKPKPAPKKPAVLNDQHLSNH